MANIDFPAEYMKIHCDSPINKDIAPTSFCFSDHNISIMKDISYQSLWIMSQLHEFLPPHYMISYLVIHFILCKQSVHAVNFQSQVVDFSDPFWNWFAFCIDSLG